MCSSQRKLIIVTAALQVNPISPFHPLVMSTGITNRKKAAVLNRRTRRRTRALSSTITQSDSEKVDECRDHTEHGEDPRQPWFRSEQFVHAPSPPEPYGDCDRKHPADR